MPIDSTAVILAAAASGVPLPDGEWWFTAPLVLNTGARLRGGGYGYTVLRPLNADYHGDLVKVHWAGADAQRAEFNAGKDAPAVDLGMRLTVVEGLSIVGSGGDYNGQWGLKINCPQVRIRDVEVFDCERDVEVVYGVDVAFESCHFRQSACPVFLPAGSHVTTTTFRNCYIRSSRWNGAFVEFVIGGLTFDSCIFESNALYGLSVVPSDPRCGVVYVHNCWFEANGVAHIFPSTTSALVNIKHTTFVTNNVPTLVRG